MGQSVQISPKTEWRLLAGSRYAKINQFMKPIHFKMEGTPTLNNPYSLK
jgi:hypothetical protein